MKKRILNFLMVVALGTALTACGADNTSNTGNSGTVSPPPENTNSDANGEMNEKPDNDEEIGGDSDGNAGGTDDESANAGSTKEIVDAMLAKVEQPVLAPIEGDMVKDLYHVDPALFEDYEIRTPLMNVKTNEIALIKVNNTADIAAVEEGIKQRAADVQKQFETYLPDQYTNAKNYKLAIYGNYVLFVISESADQLIAEYEALTK